MALFKRTKKDSVLPEVDKYYEGERRDRTGLAWLLALVSVAIVAFILIGVFLAGRWAYREITKDEDVAVTETIDQGAPSFDGETNPSTDESETDQEAEPTPAPTETEEGSVDAPARTDVPSTPAPQVPAAGDAPLPSTGPANVVATFISVSTLAAAAHYAFERRKTIR